MFLNSRSKKESVDECFSDVQNEDFNDLVTQDELNMSQNNEAEDFSSGKYDEQLISLVQSHPALYDHRLPVAERTKLKKKDIWQVISNNFEGTVI